MCNESRNKSKYYYFKYSKVAYYLGAPNYWFEEFRIPQIVKNVHDVLSVIIHIIIWLYFASEMGSFLTQHNLNEEQKSRRAIFSVLHPVLYTFVHILAYHKDKVKDVSYNLIIKLKDQYNDVEIEDRMIKLGKVYSMVFVFVVTSTLFFYGAEGAIQVFVKDSNFVTIITMWPDVHDASLTAGVGRILAYLLWWIYVARVLASAYIVVILITICLSHQYKNLCSYFYTLNEIFNENILQEEMEQKYEHAFKVGVGLHLNTLRCTNLTQDICNQVFSIQIFVNIVTLIMLMLQLVNSERTLANTMPILFTILCVLLSTGCLWWNAGDITVAASKLPTAMFSSGWHNCQKEAVRRIKPMLLVALWHSQRPVELRCLGIFKLSYESYVTIVKSSYSIFSVLY